MPIDAPRNASGSIFDSAPSLGAPATAAEAGNGLASLPDLRLPRPATELFDPARHLPEHARAHGGPSAFSPLPLFTAMRANPQPVLIPRPEDCYALWQRYAMMEHIKAHSARVADLAHAMALAAGEKGAKVNADEVLAAGLLHDLGKTYTILHGGNHAQIGASWAMRETGNAAVARAVMFHVHWPFAERFDDDDLFPVLAVIYADKRTKHDRYVSLDERFDDLVERYGVSEHIKERIALSLAQGKRIEAALSRRLGVKLDECVADSGRLVKRA